MELFPPFSHTLLQCKGRATYIKAIKKDEVGDTDWERFSMIDWFSLVSAAYTTIPACIEESKDWNSFHPFLTLFCNANKEQLTLKPFKKMKWMTQTGKDSA